MSEEREMRRGGYTAADGDRAAAPSRPSGKRTARRVRTSSGPVDTGAIATLERAGGHRPRAAARRSRSVARPVEEASANPIKRLTKFLREVVAELRKVIWPNRRQMVTYTSVVLVFVIFMVAFISGLDLAFIKGVSWLFG